MTPLSRKSVFDHAHYSIKSDVGRKLTVITGCEDYENTFARIESDCMLRFDCKVLMKSISYTKQSNLSSCIS